MKNYNNEDYIIEAINIADEILESAIRQNDTIRWSTHDHLGNWHYNNSFYNGISGIIFFLLEVYKVTGIEKYFLAAELGCNGILESEYSEDKNLNLYCGLGGVSYVLILVYELNKNYKYKEHALKIINHCKRYKYQITKSDVLTGVAGCILTLLLLHNILDENWIIDEIISYITILIDRIIVTDRGICWDRDGKSIRPLLGFSHGASGIAYIFNELYKYLGNESFLLISNLAFEYENTFFTGSKDGEHDLVKNNWPDFRKDVVSETAIESNLEAYLSSDLSPFIRPSYMSAWCHGAPGIGMSRLESYLTTQNKKQFDFFLHALENTKKAITYNSNNYTLCHGIYGNVNLLLDYYNFSNDEDTYEIIHTSALKGLQEKEKLGFYHSGFPKILGKADCSLFMGTAGIGHFFLRLAYMKDVQSIMLFNLPRRFLKPNILELNNEYVLKKIYILLFSNTSLHFSDINFSNPILYCFNNIINFFNNRINEEILNSSNEFLINAYKIDRSIIDIEKTVVSDAYIFTAHYSNQYTLNKYNVNDFSISELLSSKFKIAINNLIHLHDYNINNINYYIVFYINFQGKLVKQFFIGKFIFDILNCFKNKMNSDDVYTFLLNSHFDNTTYSKENINEIISEQFKYLLKYGFLIIQ